MENIKTFKVKYLGNESSLIENGEICKACYWINGEPSNQKTPYIHLIDKENILKSNNLFYERFEILKEESQVEIVTCEQQPYTSVWLTKSNKEDEIKISYTEVEKFACKIIYNGNTTIVILDDGSKGIAKCMPDDTYDKQKGIDIAGLKALVKSYQKKIKKLIK